MTLHIKEQGVYTAGGSVKKADGVFDPVHGQLSSEGQLRYSDHASIFYQIPEEGNGKRVMFLHGYGGNKETWMKTPYSDGFADMFLEDGYSIFLADAPMYGAAAKVSEDAEVSAVPDDLTWFTQFRLGMWPDFAKGTQFPVSKENIETFFRMMTVPVGTFDIERERSAMNAALEKSGPSLLVTHSQGGIPGWFIAGTSENVTGVIAIEPGTFIMPEEDCPDPTPSNSAFGGKKGQAYVPVKDEIFEPLLSKPIAIYFGDYIPDEPSDVPVSDHWRVTREHAHVFANYINRHGGDAKVISLPDEGIYGNSHFMFQEKNNKQIYEHMHHWMKERNL